MTDTPIDPVRTLRMFAQSAFMASALRQAIEDTCDEVESLRAEAYETSRREEDAEELATRHLEYRVFGIKEDGTKWESWAYKGGAGRDHCIELLELVSDGRMEWRVEPQIEVRTFMETPWTAL